MTEWREKFKTWARSCLPPGSCWGWYDEDLLSAGRAGLGLSQRRQPNRCDVRQQPAGRCRRQSGIIPELLGDDWSVIPLPEVALNRQQWVPENEAGRCAALKPRCPASRPFMSPPPLS